MDAMKPPRPADRYSAEQLVGVAEAIARHEDKLMPFLPRFGWADNSATVEPGTCQLYDRAALASRLEEASDSEKALKHELRKAQCLGPVRRLAKAPGPQALRRLAEDFPHFCAVIDLVAQRCSLARVTPGATFCLPPILLTGDPGVGKTAFAEALAGHLAQPIQRVDIAAATAGFDLGGSHESWGGARHGRIWTLLQSEMVSGILMLEELDKAGSSNFPILGPLYALLEPVSARHFRDAYIDIEVDASRIMVVGTCNDADQVEPALRSRFREFRIPAPTKNDMPAISRSIYRVMRSTQPWAAPFSEELPEDVLERLIEATPRQLYRALEDAHARAAEDGRLHLLPKDIAIQQTGRDGTARRLGFI